MMQYQKHLPRKFYKIPIYFNLKSTNFFSQFKSSYFNRDRNLCLQYIVFSKSKKKKQTQKLEKKRIITKKQKQKKTERFKDFFA